ncbi:MAG TPA: sodium:proton antiporter, partial [Verrucomicrobiae bacterium]|nr:sodium:proton antiporter [Verrucomicrobiae bacterium]
MKKVLLFSLLLVAGLVASQFLGERGAGLITWLTLIGLSFIMIHVGYEFDMDKSRPRQYVWDYIVAFTAAAFPWIFCAAYFVYVLAPRELWGMADQWKEALLLGRFASPTSAGVLFSMLAAAGLASTWVFRKARILAIFDDLDTILLMIPLKIMMVGFKWQLSVLVVVIVGLLWVAWRYLHLIRLPFSWPWVLGYSVAITAVCEGIYHVSKVLDDSAPVHLEVLLPAFVLGCVMARPHGHEAHDEHH